MHHRPSIVLSSTRERYPYPDQYGEDNYWVIRNGHGKDKAFYIRSVDGEGKERSGLNGNKPVPYNLPAVIKAKNQGKTIYIVEGEKDADTAIDLGVVGTTNHGGAGKWREVHSKYLRGAQSIVILYDRDDEGRKHAWQVHDSLRAVGGVEKIQFMRAAIGKDLTDHVSEGLGLSDLVVSKPKRSEPKQTESQEVEVPNADLPLAFRHVLAQAKGLKPEHGKVHQYNALCPSHDDNSPSLSISLNARGQTLLVCHGPCEFPQIAAAFGMTVAELSQTYSDAEDTSYERMVEDKTKSLHVNADAKFKFNMERQRNILDVGLLGDTTGVEELQIPEESEQWLIDSWIPADSLILLNAERKTGKTVMCLSLAKAICDEEPFLGVYQTNIEEPGMRVLYLNYEMTGSMFRRWFRQAEFSHPENFLVQHLKGRSLPFHDTYTRDALARYCARMQVGVIIFDTQIKAMADLGVNENDNTEVTGFHQAIETLMELSGVRVSVLPHHLGKADKEKGRGASRIEDGVDVIMTLAKEDGADELEAHAPPRHLRGEGREVAHDPVTLVYHEETNLYTTTGVSPARQQRFSKHEAFVERLGEFYTNQGHWPNSSEAKKLTHVSNKENGQKLFIEECRALGLVARKKVVTGSGKASIQYRPRTLKGTT